MAETSETLLHRLGLHIPTDRFRSLILSEPLDEIGTGAAMFVDVSGFTPLTVNLVEEYGPQRASEELTRRINPMFEAIAGLVFTHGGSVIRFVGDGFTAWFPDNATNPNPLPGIIRAAIASIEMLEMMVFFKGLDIKVGVTHGTAHRWVVGEPKYGLIDILTGAAVEGVTEVSARCLPHQARASRRDIDILKQYPHLHYIQLEDGDILLTKAGAALVEQSSSHRWAPWQAGENVEGILEQVKQFVDPLIQEQEMVGYISSVGELRYATPVFLRFKGLDYNNDPDAHQKLDSYIRDVQSILDDTKGRLVSLEVADKGSVVFAVFGAPIAYGDDSRRAVHAMLTFRDLPHVHPWITGQNIGASRGLLYSGTVGGEVRHEYTSLGDETNVASRLMSADDEGKILISQAIYDDCGEWFEVAEDKTVNPKGRVGLIKTYTPIRVKQQVRHDERKQPIVGRDGELIQIHRAIRNVGEGHPQVLRIEGEAGIGKSRLAAEIAFHAKEANHLVSIGNASSTDRSTAFHPWQTVLRAALDIKEDWSAASQLEHLENWVAERNTGWISRMPLLSDILNLPISDNPTTRNLGSSARQQALFSLVMEILYSRATAMPLTLIFEDTHWLDEPSENLLAELVNRLTTEPVAILVILLHRTAQENPHPTILLEALEKTYIHQHIVLHELSEQALGELIENRLGGIIPPELRTFIYEKSQGNPFFAQEIVGALSENTIIKRVGPRVYVDDFLNNIDIPQTVQGLILARIDSLPEAEKLILKHAAVIGKEFTAAVLFNSLAIKFPTQDFLAHLKSLTHKQFVVGDPFGSGGVYTFRHAITQEVTYQTLLYDQRKQWHHKVGMVLENPSLFTPPERLAYHFSQTDDFDRAFVYLVHAGDRSAHEFANHSALEYWGKAIELARSNKESFDLLCKRLELLMRTADIISVDTDLRKIVELASTAPDNLNWQLRKFRYLAEHAMNRNDWERAKTMCEEGIQLSNTYHDPQIIWELYSILVQVYAHFDDRIRRQAATQHLRAIAIELKDPAKGLRLALSDTLELASEDHRQALDTLQRLNPDIVNQADPLLEANYWNTVSQIAIQNRLLADAETALQTQLRIWRQIGNRRMECITLLNLGNVDYYMGQFSISGAYIRESFTIASQVEDHWNEANCLVGLGALAYRREAYGEAAAYIERGLGYFQDINAQNMQGRTYYLLGLVELGREAFDEARHHFRRSLSCFHNSEHYEHIPQVELALAYTAARSATLPMQEEFQSAIAALKVQRFTAFHEPDVAFWQAYYLSSRLKHQENDIREAFLDFLNSNLDYLNEPAARETFLNIGNIRKLIDKLRLKQF